MSIIRHSLAMMFLAGVLASCGGNSGKDEKTQVKYETNQKLAEKRIISGYVLSTSMNAYHVAQAAVLQAEAQLEMALTSLGYCTLRSPISALRS